jgi:Ca2+-binding RTX toxin-like protein
VRAAIPRVRVDVRGARSAHIARAEPIIRFREEHVMIRKQGFRPALETLEDRCVPTASSVLLQNGVLGIAVDPTKAHTVSVSQPTADQVQVVLDKTKFTFDSPVAEIDYQGGAKGDLFSNLTSVGGKLNFGAGNDYVYSKAAGEIIDAGAGNNFVQDQTGGNTIAVGDGNNNIYGGAGDTINIGGGKNVVYDILGSNVVNIAPHTARDFIFSNAQSTVNGATANDRVAVFFAANRQVGSGAIVLEQGVLYFAANNNGDQYTLNEVGNKIVAVYNLGDGTGFHTQTFKKADVKLIANFGGTGNDTLINNTVIPDVQYGAGGNNLLMGGFGVLDLEKAGGAAGNSTAIGRSPVFNDLNGAGSTAATTVLVSVPCAETIFRTNNPADTIVGFTAGDVFISPFKLKAKNGTTSVTG